MKFLGLVSNIINDDTGRCDFKVSPKLEIMCYYFLIVLLYVLQAESVVRRYPDGSISSNSGPRVLTSFSSGSVPAANSIKARRLRSNFMIVSKTDMTESRPLDGEEISRIVEEHNKYRRTVSCYDPQDQLLSQRFKFVVFLNSYWLTDRFSDVFVSL